MSAIIFHSDAPWQNSFESLCRRRPTCIGALVNSWPSWHRAMAVWVCASSASSAICSMFRPTNHRHNVGGLAILIWLKTVSQRFIELWQFDYSVRACTRDGNNNNQRRRRNVHYTLGLSKHAFVYILFIENSIAHRIVSWMRPTSVCEERNRKEFVWVIRKSVYHYHLKWTDICQW